MKKHVTVVVLEQIYKYVLLRKPEDKKRSVSSMYAYTSPKYMRHWRMI